MKVKTGIIYSALETIIELSEKPMKVSLAAKLLRLSDDLQKENSYTEKQRRNIITKYGVKDENGELVVEEGNVKFENSVFSDVQKELNELSEIEVDIPDRMITLEEIENNNIELTIKQLALLQNFFHKEEKEEIEVID